MADVTVLITIDGSWSPDRPAITKDEHGRLIIDPALLENVDRSGPDLTYSTTTATYRLTV